MDEVRAGQPQKGIELLMREADQEKSSRARFLRRSEAAQIMVDTGLEAVALPMLKELLEQIEAHKLEDWRRGMRWPVRWVCSTAVSISWVATRI